MGGIIALIISPISKVLKVKYKINAGVSTLLLSFLAVAIVISLTSYLVILASSHLMNLLNNFMVYSDEIDKVIIEIISNANIYLDHYHETANFDIETIVTKYSNEIISIVKNILTSLISFATSIPYIIIFIVTLFISSYFIAKDLDKIESKFYSIFTQNARIKVKNIKREVAISFVGYVRAYTILIVITFITIWSSFSVFNIKHAFLLAIMGGLLDLIPFLGITVIFLPVMTYLFILENYVRLVGISIVFLVLSIVRQILEPKLLSVNTGISPISSVAAIFIGVQIRGIIGIIFCLGLVAMHDILKKVEIL